MADVILGMAHFVRWRANDKTWQIPHDCLLPVDPEDEEQIGTSLWLRLRPSHYGLCKLLGCSGSSPTISGSTGYTQLLQLRADAMVPKSSLWDGDEDEEKPKKKKKKKLSEPTPKLLELDNGMVMKYPKKSTDDITIPYTQLQIKKFLDYMVGEGIEASKRSYQKSGKYIGKRNHPDANDAKDEEDE